MHAAVTQHRLLLVCLAACLQEYKDGKLMHTYPLKAPKLAAINAALNEGPQEKHAARGGSSSSKAAAARVVTPLGEVVFKGHSAYDLAAQLQLGIRWVLNLHL